MQSSGYASASGRRACRRRRAPRRRSSCCCERGYTACEIDFERGFWMDYPWAEALRRARPRRAGSRSPCTRRSPASWATSSATRSTGWRSGCSTTRPGSRRSRGAELVVFHPGFLLGRTRKQTRSPPSSSSSASCASGSRARIARSPFGVEMMGRVRDFGSARRHPRDLARLGWVRPVIDFAHLHATSDGAFTDGRRRSTTCSRPSTRVLRARRAVPHPLLRHRVREPERDEAPALRRGHAARGAARRRRWRASRGRRR